MEAVTMKALVYKGPGQKSWKSVSVLKVIVSKDVRLSH